MDDKYVTKDLCQDRYEHVLARLDQIWEAVNPGVIQTRQILDNHIKHQMDSWSKSQILIAGLLAIVAIGSLIVSMVVVLRK